MEEDKKLYFENEFWPQYRDADEDGLIGLRGFMNYFQDITSHHLFYLGTGNIHIYPKYGKIWLLTKYKLKILKKVKFTNENLKAKTWVEKTASPVVVNQFFAIYKDEELYAYGKLELCSVDFETQRLSKLTDIEFNRDYMVETPENMEVKFDKINDKNLEEKYSHTHDVRYTDVDNSKHMNNLAYISMFLDYFDCSYYNNIQITDFSINYVNQSYLGEKIYVYVTKNDSTITMIARKNDETIVAKCLFSIENKCL